MVFGLTAAGTALFAAVRLLVHGRPGAAFGFLLGRSALLVTFLNVLRLALLFVRIR